jgi:molybdopterin molybdotransferase
VGTFSFDQARECVLAQVSQHPAVPGVEQIELLAAAGRVLAERVVADRDYPPFARSSRDGFAVRAADLPGSLQVIGEVRAGEKSTLEVGAGQAIEIMTGAPVPVGSDAVVMVEHTTSPSEPRASASVPKVAVARTLQPGENISPQACEARINSVLLNPGQRLGFAEIALLASVGRIHVHVFRKPRIAILATGDEIVEVAEKPLDYQIRNSNAQSLAIQVQRAGGCPHVLPIARDRYDATRELVEQGLQFDLLLLSGGVSAGKYDIVERVLADLGAEFFFDRVLIQPGQPLVFGKAQGKFFFGLPGNPASTMVTFEIFARAAVELLGGEADPMLPLLQSRLSKDFNQKTGLTRFFPARLSSNGSEITPVGWQGSGDVAALTRSNAFLVTEPDREKWSAGDLIRVLMK